MISEHLLEVLQTGLKDLGEDPGSHPCESYLAYLDLLDKWNRAYNLTAVRGMDNLLTHHVLDSLSVLPYIKGTACLDVGSGAGLPGLVLAMARPQQGWTLLDSNVKKIRFLNQAGLELNLNNVTVIHSRIEDYLPEQQFSSIISRALTSLPEFYERVRALLVGGGRIIAMKGRFPGRELKLLKKAGVTCDINELEVPGLGKKRHIAVIEIKMV